MGNRDWLLKKEYDFVLLFNKATGSERIYYFMIDPRSNDRMFPKMNTAIFHKLRNLVGYKPVVVSEMLYIIGGKCWNTGEMQKNVWQYNPVTGKWRTCANMHEGRCRFTADLLDGKIYVTGGEVGHGKVTESVECYDPVEDRWALIKSLPRPRVDHASCVCNRRLYVSGGISQLKHQCSSVFWSYDPLTNEWCSPCPNIFLPDEREKHIMVPIKDDYIYIMAGRGFDQESFQEKDESNVCSYWSGLDGTGKRYKHFDKEHPHMCNNRVQPGYIVLEKRIYLFGGKNSLKDREVIGVDYYQPKKRKWRQVFSLPFGYSYANMDCVRLTIPITNRDFTFNDLQLYDKWIMW